MVSLPTDEQGKPNWVLIAVLGGAALAFITIITKRGGTATAGGLTPDEMVALGGIQQQELELKGLVGQNQQDLLAKLAGMQGGFDTIAGNFTQLFGNISQIQDSLTNLGLSLDEQKSLLTDIGARFDPLTGAIEGFGTQFASITDLLEELKNRNPTQYNALVSKYPKIKYSARVGNDKYKFSWQGWPNWWQTPPADWLPFPVPPWPVPPFPDHIATIQQQNSMLDAGAGTGQLMQSDPLSLPATQNLPAEQAA